MPRPQRKPVPSKQTRKKTVAAAAAAAAAATATALAINLDGAEVSNTRKRKRQRPNSNTRNATTTLQVDHDPKLRDQSALAPVTPPPNSLKDDESELSDDSRDILSHKRPKVERNIFHTRRSALQESDLATPIQFRNLQIADPITPRDNMQDPVTPPPKKHMSDEERRAAKISESASSKFSIYASSPEYLKIKGAEQNGEKAKNQHKNRNDSQNLTTPSPKSKHNEERSPSEGSSSDSTDFSVYISSPDNPPLSGDEREAYLEEKGNRIYEERKRQNAERKRELLQMRKNEKKRNAEKENEVLRQRVDEEKRWI